LASIYELTACSIFSDTVTLIMDNANK